MAVCEAVVQADLASAIRELSMNRPHIGIVTPVHNEQECLPELRDRLRAVLEELPCTYDVYLIDDGSTDRSPQIIRSFAAQDSRWHGVFLARNFGHQAAITAGLRAARGDVIVVMDGDLQDEPDAIPVMLRKWQQGYDTVYAVRTKRKEGLFYRLAYWLFYRLLCGTSREGVPMDAGDFCLIDRRVADAINSLPESGRFVRGLRAWVGFRQIGVEVERNARAAGTSKYTFGKLVRLAADGIMDFSWIPLRAVSAAGFLSIIAAVVYLATILLLEALGHIEIAGWTTVVLLVIGFGGMILLSLGVIGEYLGRTYAEVKRRPAYIIADTTDRPEQCRRATITRSAAAALITPAKQQRAKPYAATAETPTADALGVGE